MCIDIVSSFGSFDKYFPKDRYLINYVKKVKRKIFPRPESTGPQRELWHLREGLDELGINYRMNDLERLKKGGRVVGVIDVWALEKVPRGNKIILGPMIPIDVDMERLDSVDMIEKFIVASKWKASILRSKTQKKVEVWGAGIPTSEWCPSRERKNTIVIYDKVVWDKEDYDRVKFDKLKKKLGIEERIYEIVEKAKECVEKSEFKATVFRYGNYLESNFKQAVKCARGMVFLSAHESHGFAYLQTLSCNTPILAWEEPTGFRDPKYPNISMKEATSTPYWSEKCGERFRTLNDLEEKFIKFKKGIKNKEYNPRHYITENMTLKKRAKDYLNILK